MRIDNPTGFTSNLTGSFTGSFFGDGSGLTGTDSGSWDGDFTGSAEITGSLRITGSLDTTGDATFGGSISASNLSGTNSGDQTNITGNAGTATLADEATKLATARNIGGVPFDGSSAISLPGVNLPGTESTSGNAGTVTNGVYTIGNQTIAGVKTFSGDINIVNEATTTSQATLAIKGKQTTAANNPVGEIIFFNDNDSFATIAGARDGADNKGALLFQTQNGASGFGTHLTIASTGAATFSGNIIGNSSDTMEIGALGTGAIKRIRMTQGGEIHFGDTTTLSPLGLTEGLWNDFSDVDRLSLYCRNNLRIFTYPDATEKLIVQPGGVKASIPIYSSYVASLITPLGGTQDCRIIEDSLGKWIQVGRFAADAALTIQSTFSSVSGLSTGELQSETTSFSADWGNAYPTEVRIMGATNFTQWLETRTIDFIYRVPTGRTWGTFFNAGNANGNVYQTPIGNKYGWDCAGTYDGFGRWNNPNQTQVGMSDNSFTNPSSAYSTPTSNAFNWNTAGDAKFSVIHNAVMSGQDNYVTSAVGNDDGIIGFFDSFPTTILNMTGGRTYSSAVWVLIKLN